MSLVSFLRSPVWHDDLTLWSDTIQKSPESPTANYKLATAYLKQKDHAMPQSITNAFITRIPPVEPKLITILRLQSQSRK